LSWTIIEDLLGHRDSDRAGRRIRRTPLPYSAFL
jgi:hypothetical protein